MDLNTLTVNDINIFNYIRDSKQSIDLVVGVNGIGKTQLLQSIAEVAHCLPNEKFSIVNLLSFEEIEQEEVIEDWRNLSRKYPHARGYILRLLQMAAPNFLDFCDGEDGDEFLVEFSDSNKLANINDMSSGFKRLFEITVKAWSYNSLLLIDDIEIGLHHTVQKPLWEYLVKTVEARNTQIIASTHSGDTIMAFARATKNNPSVRGNLLRLGHSKRTSDKGKLITTCFDETELANLHSMGIDARG